MHAAGIAQAVKLPLLQNPQQLGLQPQRHLAYFVEQQRAPMRQFEAPRFGRHGSSKGTPGIAEQFAFEQRLGKRRAIHRHKRTIAARAQPMNQPRHQLFPGTAFRLDQNIGIARRRLARPVERPQPVGSASRQSLRGLGLRPRLGQNPFRGCSSCSNDTGFTR